MSGEAERLAATCQRLAETQANLPVPLRADERIELREAAWLLRQIAETAVCPNQHGLMRPVVGLLAPGGPIGRAWKCDTCGMERMWPDPRKD